MQHSIEDLIKKINVMHDRAILLHRERNKYSDLSESSYDKKACQHILDQIQQMALEIAMDREGDEILTDMEYKR
jgi:hypothetical protein